MSQTPPLPPLEAMLPDAALIAGIAAYRRHPWHRQIDDPPVIWADGSSRLLEYGQPGAPPVLLVPSLINRAYVLDLLPEASMLRSLAARGLRPLLLDWGTPGEAEADFTLTDYVAARLEPAMAAVGEPVALAGYCMGGLLAAAAAQRRPDLTRALALLATPWDFHTGDAQAIQSLRDLPMLLEPAIGLAGALSVDMLQLLFSLLEPGSVGAKYRDFATQDPASPRARRFVAIEDWLNDGVPLMAPVAREVLGGWYGRNTPACGLWRIAGRAVDPGALTMPCFIAIPERDRIVPAASAMALARLIPHAVHHRPRGGHVGMVAGAGAEAGLWGPLADWLMG